MDFPDRIHLEKIRSALWNGKEFGKAAIFVGAGFSRNADPIRLSVSTFPLWPDLAKGLLAKLYPPSSNTKPPTDSLRLADEFEAAFGRDSLDRFLLDAVPDADHRPGTIHHNLLKLPWSEILTTNYDTLLERTTDLLTDKAYDVVRQVEEIPGASKPRIIKLHGSFPSTRPFIITEEDFRTYPKRFAAFVNLAQQIFMENVVCLIGFSGDDPNFLHWTGWVRDHLGRSAPQIYICGLLNLNAAKRNLYHQRNVVPIDLSVLFDNTIHHLSPALRHHKAME